MLSLSEVPRKCFILPCQVIDIDEYMSLRQPGRPSAMRLPVTAARKVTLIKSRLYSFIRR